MECVPAARFETLSVAVELVNMPGAMPGETGTVPTALDPSKNVTEPRKLPAGLAAIVALNVTICPVRDGFREDDRVVVVETAFNVCASVALVLPCVFVSPEYTATIE